MFLVINVSVTSLHANSEQKLAMVCESIKEKLVINGNAYKTHVPKKENDMLYKMAISDFLYFVKVKILIFFRLSANSEIRPEGETP